MEMLKEYKNEYGDLLIPIRYKKNPSLGKFIHNTREQYKLYHGNCKEGYKKKCSLTAERIKQLEDLGFVFSTDRKQRQEEDWEGRLEQLKAYKKKHGDCLVPYNYREDPSFTEWIHRQRTNYSSYKKSGKPNALLERRFKKLEEIGFVFKVHPDKWLDLYNELKQFKEKNSHCQVPTHYVENPRLGRWVHSQRHHRRLQLKGRKSCMTAERVKMLDDLEFSWEVRSSLDRPRVRWSQRLEQLREFYETHRHFRVPASSHYYLHAWCADQRLRLRQVDRNGGTDVSHRMGPDRIMLLHELGFTKDVELADSETTSEDLVEIPVTDDADEANERKESEQVQPQAETNLSEEYDHIKSDESRTKDSVTDNNGAEQVNTAEV